MKIGKIKERHTNLWAVFNGREQAGSRGDAAQWLRPEDVRQDFYKALNLFSKTLQIAIGSAKFHEETPKATVDRYLKDLAYFPQPAGCRQAGRYNEAVEYKEYEGQIRNMINKYVRCGSGQADRKPVNVLEVEVAGGRTRRIEGAAAKADFIASRVKRTCTDGWRRTQSSSSGCPR